MIICVMQPYSTDPLKLAMQLGTIINLYGEWGDSRGRRGDRHGINGDRGRISRPLRAGGSGNKLLSVDVSITLTYLSSFVISHICRLN